MAFKTWSDGVVLPAADLNTYCLQHPNYGHRALFQFGNSVVGTDGSGIGSVSYPTQFPSTVYTVVCTPGDNAVNVSGYRLDSAWMTTLTGFSFVAFNLTGGLFVSSNTRIMWLAIGS